MFLPGHHPGDQAAPRNSHLSTFLPPALSRVPSLSSPSIPARFPFSLLAFLLFNQRCVSSCLVISLRCSSKWKAIPQLAAEGNGRRLAPVLPHVALAAKKTHLFSSPSPRPATRANLLPSLTPGPRSCQRRHRRKDASPRSHRGSPFPQDAHPDPCAARGAP